MNIYAFSKPFFGYITAIPGLVISTTGSFTRTTESQSYCLPHNTENHVDKVIKTPWNQATRVKIIIQSSPLLKSAAKMLDVRNVAV